MEQKEYVCCICGEINNGFGNNPWPVVNDEKSKCCDRCNFEIVLPERLKLIYKKERTTQQ